MNRKFKNHFSATHGVEGHVGAAGQLSLVEDPVEMDKNTACIMVFGVNSFGYAWNGRVNESSHLVALLNSLNLQ